MTLRLPATQFLHLSNSHHHRANTGLGLETAKHIVSVGASKVILGVRTLSKGLSAKADIEATTGRLGVVEAWEIDLDSVPSVRAFAARAKSLERVDTAVMNAGLANTEWRVSSGGWEQQLQVNVLSTSLLSLLLLPLLVQTRRAFPESRPHLVLLASDIHEEARLEERNADNVLQALNDKKTWEESKAGVSERYAVSKLFDLHVSIELAGLVPSIGGEPAVFVDSVAPGFCKSELLSRKPGTPWSLKSVGVFDGQDGARGEQDDCGCHCEEGCPWEVS